MFSEVGQFLFDDQAFIPNGNQYQPHSDVQAQAKIDLDVEEILAKLPSDGAADFTGAMAIYSGGGDSKAIIAATLESLATPGATTMASDTWYPVYKAYWDSQVNYADKFVQDAASGTLPDAMRQLYP